MKVKAHAKINLSLDVVGKREDGYHLLEMVMQSIDLHDELTLDLTQQGIELTCNLPYVPLNSRNIAYKAIRMFLDFNSLSQGIHLHIEKRIPVGAGLAGGSTNAAATLMALNEMFGYPMSMTQLLNLGLSLGADVPFTMIGGTALCEGVGELITKLPDFSGKIVVLTKPPFSVSTKQIFSEYHIDKVNRHPETKRLIQGIQADDFNQVAANLGNVLENVTLKQHPVLRSIKKELRELGAAGCLMSGSGPTVFGLFDDRSQAKAAYAVFAKRYRETFLTTTIGSLPTL